MPKKSSINLTMVDSLPICGSAADATDESQSSFLTSFVNVSRNAVEMFMMSFRFPNRPILGGKKIFRDKCRKNDTGKIILC